MIKNPYPGLFIVIEGVDGAGKSTQAKAVGQLLKKFHKKDVCVTYEPTQFIVGGLIRSRLLGDWKSSPECLQLLFAADRAYHLDTDIIPMLKKGIAVISDRYVFSSLAYGALDSDMDWLKEVNRNFLMPDLLVYLDVPITECVRRLKQDRYSIELFEKVDILQKVRHNYKKTIDLFKKEGLNAVQVNGDRPIGEVAEEILKLTGSKLKQHGHN